jgi:opacity protein-like surface antigen
MKQFKRNSIAAFALNAMLIFGLSAQQYNVPLTMEGLNHTANSSVVSKGMGGVTIPIQQDVALMFANPASLSTLNGFTVSLGGGQAFTNSDQSQQWYPLVYYGNFSLLMDGTVRGIGPSGVPYTPPSSPARYPGDTIQYPYDNLLPNWDHKRNSAVKMPEIFAALPLTIGQMKGAVGVGITQYANMDYFYANNNTLTPDYDLLTTPQTTAPESTRLDWAQTSRLREGNIYGYGGAVSLAMNNEISAGISVRYLKGSTDDLNQVVGRGVFWFYGGLYSVIRWGVSSNTFVLDSVDYQSTIKGTSDFTGFEYTISSLYRTKNFTIGFALTPPSTITREFSGKVTLHQGSTIDYTALSNSTDATFTEKMKLPWKGRLGIGFQVNPNFLAALEYEYFPYSQAELDKDGVISKPWRDASTFRFGLNWTPASELAVRFGYRKQKETFVPQNAAYLSDPVSYNVYSAGVGYKIIPNLLLNVAYEFYQMKYEDVWAENYNINNLKSHTVSAELSYTLE